MDRIEQLQQFLKESPHDCFLKHALAMEYIKLNKLNEARLFLEENKAYDPNYIATYYHLGLLLEKLDLEKEAIDIYEQGMKIAKTINDQHAYGELKSVYEELLY